MPVNLEQDESSSLVRLEGDIGIECAAELKELLIRGLRTGRSMRVSLESARELDVTAIQLLWAASREARAAGAVFAFEGPATAAVNDVLARYGLGELPASA